jgi:hypothetical protein
MDASRPAIAAEKQRASMGGILPRQMARFKRHPFVRPTQKNF